MLDVIAQHQFLGVRMEADLLWRPCCTRRRLPIGSRIAVQGNTAAGRVPWQKPPGAFYRCTSTVYLCWNGTLGGSRATLSSVLWVKGSAWEAYSISKQAPGRQSRQTQSMKANCVGNLAYRRFGNS